VRGGHAEGVATAARGAEGPVAVPAGARGWGAAATRAAAVLRVLGPELEPVQLAPAPAEKTTKKAADLHLYYAIAKLIAAPSA